MQTVYILKIQPDKSGSIQFKWQKYFSISLHKYLVGDTLFVSKVKKNLHLFKLTNNLWRGSYLQTLFEKCCVNKTWPYTIIMTKVEYTALFQFVTSQNVLFSLSTTIQ